MDYLSVETVQKQSACIACTRAKRRCSKKLPACDRCHVKKLRCAYLMRPILLSSDAASVLVTLPDKRNSGPSDRRGPVSAALSPLEPTTEGTCDARHVVEDPWFLKPSSWAIEPVSVGDQCRITYPQSGLELCLDHVKTWLDTWTKGKHNHFIHTRLYGSDLPSSLQYAYAAWVAYRAAETRVSKVIALRMASHWAKRLAQEQSVYESIGHGTSYVVDYLARAQGLLVLQLIGLFDGDIRARSEAEVLIPELIQLADNLLRVAGDQVTISPPLPPDGELNEPKIEALRTDGSLDSAWKAWILSESLRRTWSLSRLVACAYLIMRDGHAICPGSITFEARSGLWDALSPQAWVVHVHRASMTSMPVSSKSLVHLLDESTPSDVDDFAKALLFYGNGQERVEDWLATES